MTRAAALALLLASSAAYAQGYGPPPPPPGVAPGVPEPERPPPRGAVLAFADHYPTQEEQQSIYTGVRAIVRIDGNIYAVVDVGYVAAGAEAGNGDDGIAFGGGVELAVPLRGMTSLVPFARAKFDYIATQINDLPAGTLTDSALSLHLGGRLARFLDLHLILGQRYSGGTGYGIGAGIGGYF
jgi:hypothetical protein